MKFLTEVGEWIVITSSAPPRCEWPLMIVNCGVDGHRLERISYTSRISSVFDTHSPSPDWTPFLLSLFIGPPCRLPMASALLWHVVHGTRQEHDDSVQPIRSRGVDGVCTFGKQYFVQANSQEAWVVFFFCVI